jgi:lipopolysaccharide/colanic/teichoic acid biosynthesis glycosyltransferase
MRPALTVKFSMGALVFGASFAVGKLHASLRGEYDLTQSSRFGWMIAFSLIVFLVGYALGLPESPSLKGPFQTAIVVALIPPFVFAAVQSVIGQFVLPRFFLFVSIPINACVFLCTAKVSRAVTRTSAARERIVLLCSSDEKAMVTRDVAFRTETPCLIVDHFDTEKTFNAEDFGKRVSLYDPTLAIYASSSAADEELVKALTAIHADGVRVRDLVAFYDEYIGKVPIRELEATSLFFDVRELHHTTYSRVSRMIDIGFGLLGALLLILVIPFVALGNMLGNRGPLFYSQERVGKGITVFKILKFRSMLPGGLTSQWTVRGDPRITRFGRILRLTHLDELPQVVNILRGDLSLVGPRPEQPSYVRDLMLNIPFYGTRHIVRPGLTGWAQVNYPYGADEIDAYEKLQYEFWYLRHQSVTLDFRIIARTVRHVLGFRGQ